MITRVCPVCRTGEIRARTAHALYKRACCSRACALAIAREVRANPPAPVVAARAELAAQIRRRDADGVDIDAVHRRRA